MKKFLVVAWMLSWNLMALLALAALPMVEVAQEQEPLTVEEQLSVIGNIDMIMLWDYVVAEFNPAQAQSGVVFFETELLTDPPRLHVQAVRGDGMELHFDEPLDGKGVGGVNSDDGLVQYVWVCDGQVVLDSPAGICVAPVATWIMAYDRSQRTLMYWTERRSGIPPGTVVGE